MHRRIKRVETEIRGVPTVRFLIQTDVSKDGMFQGISIEVKVNVQDIMFNRIRMRMGRRERKYVIILHDVGVSISCVSFYDVDVTNISCPNGIGVPV